MKSRLKSVPDRELAVSVVPGETVDVEVWPEGSDLVTDIVPPKERLEAAIEQTGNAD